MSDLELYGVPLLNLLFSLAGQRVTQHNRRLLVGSQKLPECTLSLPQSWGRFLTGHSDKEFVARINQLWKSHYQREEMKNNHALAWKRAGECPTGRIPGGIWPQELAPQPIYHPKYHIGVNSAEDTQAAIALLAPRARAVALENQLLWCVLSEDLLQLLKALVFRNENREPTDGQGALLTKLQDTGHALVLADFFDLVVAEIPHDWRWRLLRGAFNEERGDKKFAAWDLLLVQAAFQQFHGGLSEFDLGASIVLPYHHSFEMQEPGVLFRSGVFWAAKSPSLWGIMSDMHDFLIRTQKISEKWLSRPLLAMEETASMLGASWWLSFVKDKTSLFEEPSDNKTKI